jgi:hypothetical protein
MYRTKFGTASSESSPASQRRWSWTADLTMVGSLNRPLPKEISRKLSEESRKTGLKTSYIPPEGFQDCGLRFHCDWCWDWTQRIILAEIVRLSSDMDEIFRFLLVILSKMLNSCTVILAIFHYACRKSVGSRSEILYCFKIWPFLSIKAVSFEFVFQTVQCVFDSLFRHNTYFIRKR